jgi:hypothetical protein
MERVDQPLARVEKLEAAVAFLKKGRYTKGKSNVPDHLSRGIEAHRWKGQSSIHRISDLYI